MPVSGSYFYPQVQNPVSSYPFVETLLLRNTLGTLVLSSSAGLVRMSSSLGLQKASSAALPTGTDEMSGSIIWVNDKKQFAIYGPLGWCRITTGSVVS